MYSLADGEATTPIWTFLNWLPGQAQRVLLADTLERDRASARRMILMAILWRERHLTREGLIVRVEGQLGNGCFGQAAWKDTFFRDMRIVKRALEAAGWRLAYSRSKERPGYYINDQRSVCADLSAVIIGSVSEVDPAQIAIYRTLAPAERFRQGCSTSAAARRAVAYRRKARQQGSSDDAVGIEGLGEGMMMKEASIGYTEFVKMVIEALDEVGVDYLVGGAVAAWAWGEPRSTQDLDLVVDIPIESIQALSDALKARGMLVPAELILDAVIEDRADVPINAIHMYSGYKAELFPMRAGDELRREALGRRRLVDLGPDLGKVYLHSPEDLILYKLWYYSLSQQTKHLRDIAAILTAQGDALDTAYIERWAGRKGLNALWHEMLEQVSRRP